MTTKLRTIAHAPSGRWLGLLPLCLSLLSACAYHPRPQPSAMPALPAVAPQAQAMLPVAPPDEVAPLLAYHQSLRRMTQGELLKELSGISLQQKTPKLALQTGMILMLTRGGGDLARAQSLFDSVAGAGEAEALTLKPLAQLMSSHCAEARRLSEQNEKLQVQLKDNQRKTEQLNDTLEALKAIERGLPVRPSAGTSSGGGSKG
ncbi:hypothetical protein [Pseudoduganella violacea]|uniref:Permease n=1 Tax=Pseudoduganella violacea TaxID=1715466 RepID=A0A7W5FTQ9_9BURK|nr:hypothetical protein [Pseudoduganella violacea]MBB3118927.1 hypothetical protein [Pseudoduganella violacea]